MRVKRYEAESMQEAIMKVRAELGRDAVILHSKKFRRGGAFGLFGKQMFEVIAAVDVPADPSKGPKPQAESKASTSKAAAVAAASESGQVTAELPAVEPAVQAVGGQVGMLGMTEQQFVQPLQGTVPGRLAATAGGGVATGGVPTPYVTVLPPETSESPARGINWRPEVRLGGALKSLDRPENGSADSAGNIHGELASLRRMLHQLSSQLSKPGDEPPVTSGWTEVRRVLVEAELAGKYVDEVEEEVFRQLSDSELTSTERVMGVVRDYLSERILVERRNVAKAAGGPRVLALVGPTGVGKTTTVAKLAAMFALFANKSVGLITVDTYRIAAVDQLKTYAEIINIPVEVAFTPSEVALALGRLQDRDVVIIDTAGRSQKNELQMGELKQFLSVAAPTETHLVLSVTTKYRDLLDCLERFREVSYDHLIFTKLDETTCYGTVFNCAMEAKCPITYLTCGQNVPDDIEEAGRERVTELLLGTGVFKQ